MIYKQKKNTISNIDNNYKYLKQFVSEVDSDYLQDNYKYFIEGFNYIAKNDKDICEIMDDLLLISKNIDNIADRLNDIHRQLEEIALEKICTKLGISKNYLISTNDVAMLYPREYHKIDGEKVTILYDFETYKVEYIIEEKEEYLKTKTMIKLSHNNDKGKETIYVNNELFNLFDKETKKDIENTLYEVHDGMYIYANYLYVFSQVMLKINKEIENRHIHNSNRA